MATPLSLVWTTGSLLDGCSALAFCAAEWLPKILLWPLRMVLWLTWRLLAALLPSLMLDAISALLDACEALLLLLLESLALLLQLLAHMAVLVACAMLAGAGGAAARAAIGGGKQEPASLLAACACACDS